MIVFTDTTSLLLALTDVAPVTALQYNVGILSLGVARACRFGSPYSYWQLNLG